MNTQVHLYVKNETLWTRFWAGKLGFINIFRKLPIEVAVDGDNKKYKPQAEPYVIDVTPGTHVIEGKDPRARAKKSDKKAAGALIGAVVYGGGGGSVIAGAMEGASAFSGSNVTKTSALEVTLKEGDIFKISCQANRKGLIVFKSLK